MRDDPLLVALTESMGKPSNLWKMEDWMIAFAVLSHAIRTLSKDQMTLYLAYLKAVNSKEI